MHACFHVIAFAGPTGTSSGAEKPPGEQPVIDTSQTVYLGQEVLTKQSSLEANGNVLNATVVQYIDLATIHCILYCINPVLSTCPPSM